MAHGHHLCIFAHGMAGTKDDWAAWVECLRRRCPHWTLRPLECLRDHVKPIVGKGLDALATLAGDEILHAINEEEQLQQDYLGPLTLHCVGHSMGGLVLRAGLHKVFQEMPEVRAGVFLTLSTPHLGVQAGWGAPEALWRNLSCLTAFISPQCPQLAIQDHSATGHEPPFLVALADPEGPHIAALRRFQRRLCITMSHGDNLIPAASGIIWADKRWRKAQLPETAVVGWGFEDHCEEMRAGYDDGFCSSSSSSNTDVSSSCARDGSCTPNQIDHSDSFRTHHRRERSAVWTKSTDGTSRFPRQILEGLDTLLWERLAVRLQFRGAAVHVFLIAKTAEQGELEHLYSLECVERLAELFVGCDGAGGGQPPPPSFPCWMRTLEVKAGSREDCLGRWVVATEEGIGAVRLYPFATEVEAIFHFKSLAATSRVLFDPDRNERQRDGANIGAFSTIRKRFASPLTSPASTTGTWMLVTEEGTGNVKFYSYDAEERARKAFAGFGATSRILFDPQHVEVQRGGWNRPAHGTIVATFMCEVGGS